MAVRLSRAIVLFVALAAFACGASSEIQEIPSDALIVDVRSPGEYQAGHFPGAVNIPVDEIGGRLSDLGNKDAPIVVYCRSGNRSGRAKVMLEAAGFTHVANGGALTTMMGLAPKPPSAEQ